ncbi:nuclear cap-binding protein subunit 1-like [Glycine soja]|uniref:Nuclear cap-binding protein subunit 1 n=2 Tax=Glycine soja TaxID=3848 RepID=A0A445FEJ3_GLYSO|nr:nuclear cap-binding protein subunit 1-like [Glycine soja]KHN28574.1 Nuclear cap-binding protein subunit 1 [Glycine soja]RZB47272.1 Nuclear cap-binding protein subunit 1 isoform A [Glycine soja]
MSSWRSLLLRIGDKSPEYGVSSDYKDHIDTCFGALRRELDLSQSEILEFLLMCAEQLPHKIPLYGTLIGLINLENEDFVKQLVVKTQSKFQDALDSGNCNGVRILMRLLTVMMSSKVLQPSSLVAVFETFLSSAATTVDDEKGNPLWQSCADFYITCILSCLPWGGAELIEQVPEDIERVMVGVEAYLSIRKHTFDIGLSFFENDDENGKGLSDKDFLEDLWDRIQVLSSHGWKVDSVPRPHLSFEAQLVAGKSHEFGPICCPRLPSPPSVPSGVSIGKQKHEAELKYPQRIHRLNIFPPGKIEDLQPIDRFVMEEYLLDVLLFLNGCRKECASFMVGLPVSFRYEYLMAETIFSQLLMLPQPPFKPVYYTLVIIDLCKALPGAFPAVVAGAVRTLFERIADLDMECRTRLILWFSHHLSNFQFIWPWEEWAYVLDLPRWAPQRVFVQEVLEREVRLSYWDKVKQSIENAPGLEELLPPKGGPNFSFGAEDGKESNEHVLSGQLNNMVKGKAPVREIISWIDESVFPNNGLEVTLRVVVQTLLNIGSKSFTHLMTVLERYGQVFAKVCPDQDKQVMLIAEVSAFWKSNTQMTAIAIDRMMGYRLVSNLAIVRWVFSAENIEQFHTSDRPWEILRNAVSKTHNRISDLRKEILSLKKNFSSAEETAKEAKAELDAAESKLTLVDGEPVLGDNPTRLNRLKLHAEKTKKEVVSLQKSSEAKEALLAQAMEENEALFLLLYKSFSNVFIERLPEGARTLHELKSAQVDVVMAVDPEEPSSMELDNESQRPQNSQTNGEKKGGAYNVGEKEQWCIITLGYVKAFSRQYAAEIWPHVEKLDAEVLTEDAPLLFRSSVYSGLRRPIHDA